MNLLAHWKLRSGFLRMTPHFVIVGAQKCGTSSMYAYLIQHPKVMSALRKEIHYFDIHYGQDFAWYRSHFPLRRPGMITGEASPYYMFHPYGPARLASVVPHVKVIVLLRDPVDRAYSHWQHQVGAGRERLSFCDAIAREEERIRVDRQILQKNEFYRAENYQHFSYLARGIYIDQIMRLYRCIDASQILILQSEEFFKETQRVCDRVFDYLELEYHRVVHTRARNTGAYREEMSPEIVTQLYEYFRPYNQRLYEYLDRDFAWEGRSGLHRTKETERYV